MCFRAVRREFFVSQMFRSVKCILTCSIGKSIHLKINVINNKETFFDEGERIFFLSFYSQLSFEIPFDSSLNVLGDNLI